MAKTLNIITNGNKGGLPVQNQGLKLSKIIAVEKIEEHERFKELYSIDEDLLERITADMKENKFDASQPVHIWLQKDDDETEHFYLIDGYTRVKAARLAGLQTVPYFEHNFDSFEEAHRYALHLQVDRRNLSGMDLLHNIEELMGSEYIQNMKGNKNAAIGEMLGVSEKTIERAKFVEKNASEEQLEAIESGEATVHSTYDEIKAERKKDKSDRHVSADDDSDEMNSDSFDDFDDISESLEDTSGEPKSIVIGDHSDHIERPTNKLDAETDSERTRERKKAYELGFIDGFVQAANYAIGKFLEYDAAYVYDCIFCREPIQFSALNNLKNNANEVSDLHALRLQVKEMGVKDFNPLPLDLPPVIETENGEQALDFGAEEDSEADDEVANNSTEPSDMDFDIEFEGEAE